MINCQDHDGVYPCVVHKTTYGLQLCPYPLGLWHGNPEHVVTASNRYKYNGKEDQTVGALGLLDYGVRMYDAQIGRWLVIDPLAAKHYSESPYAYVHNSPMIHVDPDGKDGLIVISGNTITITIKSNIILTGSKATTELANIYKRDIMDNWGAMKSYTHNGTKYDIKWDVNVRVALPGENKDFNGLNNYMEVKGNVISKVRNANDGEIRSVDLEFSNPMSHEFGHLLGLNDKYIESKKDLALYGQPISEYWRWNIMASYAGLGDAEEKNMKILLEKPLEWHRLRQSIFPDKKDDKTLFDNDLFDFFRDMYFWINANNREF